MQDNLNDKAMKRFLSIIASIFLLLSCTPDNIKDLNPDEILKPSDYGDFVLQENVIFFSESFEEYVNVIDTLTIKISNKVPEEYIPATGDIIYCMKTKNSPYGFIGRVVDIDTGSSASTYHTETIDLTDIFKELHINTSVPIPEYMDHFIDSDGSRIAITHESNDIWERLSASPQDTSNVETKAQGSNTIAHTLGIGIESEYFEGKFYVGLSASIKIDISDGKLNDLSYEISRSSGIEGLLKVEHGSKDDGKIKLFEKTIMLPGALTVGPLILTTDLIAEAGFIVNGEVSLQGGIGYEFENVTYRYSYNGGKPTAENIPNNIEGNKYFMLSKFEAKADVGMYESAALEMALYHRNLLALGASAEASFTTSIGGEISFDSKELLSLNPTIKIGPTLTTGLYCHSKLFKFSGEDEKFGMFQRHQLGEVELKLFPQFMNTASEYLNGKITSTTQLVKNNFVRTTEEGFALFKKGENETPLEHKQLEIHSTKADNNDGSCTFEVGNSEDYITKPYVMADGKYFYLSEGKWVDLGLPSGILWAAYNVGATSPEEYGGYYAWGETEEKSCYTWENYKYGRKNNYNWKITLNTDIIGTNLDVANVEWGEGARMPSWKEFIELSTKCTRRVRTINNVNGIEFIGPNGNQIYIPFAGGKSSNDCVDSGEMAYLWSGSLIKSEDGYTYAPALELWDSEEWGYDLWDDSETFYIGLSIRPVKDIESQDTK